MLLNAKNMPMDVAQITLGSTIFVAQAFTVDVD